MKRLFLSLLLCTSLLTTPAYEAMGATPGTANTEDLRNYESLSHESLTGESIESSTLSNESMSADSLSDKSSTGESHSDKNISDDSPSDESLPDQNSSNESVSDQNPTNESPSDDSLSDNSLLDESLSDENSAEKSFSDKNSADESLSDDSLSGLIPSDDSLSDESLSDTLVGAAATPSPTPTKAATTYSSAVPADGKTYVIRCVTNRNYCLDIDGGSRSDKANLHIYKRSNVASQLFTLKKQNDGSFVLYNHKSDMVVTAEGNSALNQANVSQRPFTGSSLQKWQMVKCADGSYHVCCKANTNLALQVYSGKMQNGQNVRLLKLNNSNSHKYIFEEVKLPDYSGEIMLRPRYLVYGAIGTNSKSANGTNLALEIGVSDDVFQTFTLSRVWGGFYRITQKASNRVVDLYAGNAANGSNVDLYNWNGTNAQLWQVQVNSDDTYTFRSRCNLNYVLDMAGGGRAMGTNLQLYSANGTLSQKFLVTPFAGNYPQNVDLTFRSLVNTDRVFAAGAEFFSYHGANMATRKFVLKPVTHSGSKYYWYRIVTTHGKVLGVSNAYSNASSNPKNPGRAGSAANYLKLAEQDWTGANCQLWHPELQSDGTYVIRSCLDPSYVVDLKGASEDYKAPIHIYKENGTAAQRWHLTTYNINSCTISASDHNTVTVKASGATVRSDNRTAYLFAVEPYEHSLKGKSPIASASMASDLTFKAGLNKNSSSSLLQKKFYVGVKYCNIYRIVSNSFYITNPEAAATNTAAFPRSARGTKKGLKLSISDQDIDAGKNLHISSVCIDVILDNFLNGSGYNYTYEGKTYSFSNEISHYKQQIRKYNSAGILVSANIYLLSKRYPDFMQPEARNGARLKDASAVAFNTRDGGRKRVEALFACLADAFTTDGCMVANWVFGNEVNEYICFYYSGGISYNRFHESLAEGYRMFNACVKSRWKNARCYISLDHNWNVSWPVKDSYMGMNLVKDFNLDLARQGRVHWDIAMHPYPAPEQDPRFWNRSWTVTNSGDTQQITMLNLSSWAVYLKMTYGTNIHIILNETGVSSTYNGTEMLDEQAAAVALTYYLAEFDKNIDTMDYHRNIDDPGETSEGWHLGLYFKPASGWNYTRPKPSANVFRYMDSASWDIATSRYAPLTGRASWKAWIPGFDAGRFAGKA